MAKATIRLSKVLPTVLSQPKNITEGSAINNIIQTSTLLKTPALKEVGFIDISSSQAPRKTPTKTTPDNDMNNIKSSQITKTTPSKHQQQYLNKTDKTVSSIPTVISSRRETTRPVKAETKKNDGSAMKETETS